MNTELMTEETGRAMLEELRKLNENLAAQAKQEARKLPEHPMSIAEFALVVDKSTKTVRRWIDGGRLVAKREGRNVMITPVNARKFLEGVRS